MSKVKVSSLPIASTLTGTEKVMLVQGGQSVQSTLSSVVNLFSFLVAETDITSSQLLNIHTSSVSIVPAPGAGYVNVPVEYQYIFTHGGISYTSGGSPALAACYADNASYPTHTTFSTLITQAASAINAYAISSFTLFPLSVLENSAIFLKSTNGTAYAAGNGTLTVRVIYQKVAI